ncbi:MAG TPA: protein kinase, partial [Gemmatimonadaceae bacterium]|nr:protein kinase [Gemmatimonadaceae bacterium]
MATVYLAHDVRHGRDVAIKVLHPDLGAALGGERFLSEIRTTARLQHPHILPLLDSGEADGLLYYVMPYVTGETLRDRLDRERQLPIDDALRIAREVADALGDAHAHGIVHRDIKPENILLHGGHAVVADFGIALAVQSAGGHRITQTGLSLGTPQYMSPEQAMGERTIDLRSDIYSLGAVTYEMLVGDPPFTGSTVQSIVAKVLTERPTSPSTLRDTIPPSVERAVLRALSKLPADRFATAEKFSDALAATDALPAAPSIGARPGTASQPAPRRSRVMDASVLAAVAFLAAAIAWSLARRGSVPDAAWSSFTQLTDASGVETAPTLSPDGQYFAYASDARGTFDIYVQRVGGRVPVLVAGDSTTDEMWPAYSPDGQRIAYNVHGGGIFIVGATGESPRRLTSFGANAAWSPDGKRIVFGSEEVRSAYNVNANGTIWMVDVAGGEPKRIDRSASADLYQPAWSPSGERIAFWSATGGQRDLETMRTDGSDRVKLTNDREVDFGPAWSPDGSSLYFASDRGGTMGLWRIGVDQSSGRPSGPPTPIASGVDVAMDLPHPSADGTTLLFRSMLESLNPAALTFDPASGRVGEVRLLQNRTGTLTPTDVSPDGRWLALSSTFDRQQDIFIMKTDGTGLVRLTDDAPRDWNPRFTPDGKGLSFYSNLRGQYDAWTIRLDGSGRTRLSDFKPGTAFNMFAPDGKRLVAAILPRKMVIGSAPWPMAPTNTKVLDVQVRDGELTPTYWSRSGRWISGYVANEGGDVIGFGVLDPATEKAHQLNDDSRSYDLAWLPGDQKVVYFTNQGKLVMQDVTTLERRELGGSLPFRPELIGGIIASPDGRTLYYAARQSQANIWIVRQSSPTQP